jgi:hypothetical protein
VVAERSVHDVKAFLDTSVLVATFYAGREHHEPSIDLLSRQNRPTACTAALSRGGLFLGSRDGAQEPCKSR